MDHQLAMNRIFEHLERAYLLEIVVEFQAPTAARLFVTIEDPEAFAKVASDRLQALVYPEPDEQLRVGTEEVQELNLHQKQLLNLEYALVGFLNMGHSSVRKMKAKVLDEVPKHVHTCGWGSKRGVGMGWGNKRDYGK